MRKVAAAVIIEDGRLLLARRPSGDRLAGLWELPGGKVEGSETIAECLERELREELGMTATAEAEVAATVFHYDHGSFEMVAVRATRRSGYSLRAHSEVAWCTRDEVSALSLAPADVELVSMLHALGDWA